MLWFFVRMSRVIGWGGLLAKSFCVVLCFYVLLCVVMRCFFC